ncbi:hypothetical protein FACS1894216_11420 [Synergistales bacterium]|nr:hypothetical protein FACS1894216_11420 [Synergistales bacterium]
MKIRYTALILLLFAAFVVCGGSASWAAENKKPALPPFKPSGPIPGTSLVYEKMAVNEKGLVTLSIRNTERTGVRFRASFSFFSNTGEYLTGFELEGVAPASGSVPYSLAMPDYKKYKKAAFMKVLGRSGRVGGDTWEE